MNDIMRLPTAEEILSGGMQAGVPPPPSFHPQDEADGSVHRVGGAGFFAPADLQPAGADLPTADEAAAELKEARRVFDAAADAVRSAQVRLQAAEDAFQSAIRKAHDL